MLRLGWRVCNCRLRLLLLAGACLPLPLLLVCAGLCGTRGLSASCGVGHGHAGLLRRLSGAQRLHTALHLLQGLGQRLNLDQRVLLLQEASEQQCQLPNNNCTRGVVLPLPANSKSTAFWPLRTTP